MPVQTKTNLEVGQKGFLKAKTMLLDLAKELKITLPLMEVDLETQYASSKNPESFCRIKYKGTLVPTLLQAALKEANIKYERCGPASKILILSETNETAINYFIERLKEQIVNKKYQWREELRSANELVDHYKKDFQRYSADLSVSLWEPLPQITVKTLNEKIKNDINHIVEAYCLRGDEYSHYAYSGSTFGLFAQEGDQYNFSLKHFREMAENLRSVMALPAAKDIVDPIKTRSADESKAIVDPIKARSADESRAIVDLIKARKTLEVVAKRADVVAELEAANQDVSCGREYKPR